MYGVVGVVGTVTTCCELRRMDIDADSSEDFTDEENFSDEDADTDDEVNAN